MPQKIVFFVQTKKPIGGSQVLFLDLASYLAEKYADKYDVYYINHSNPLVDQLYGSSKIHLLDVEECDYTQFEEAVFFTPTNYIFYLINKIKKVKTAKICLYFYHPQIMDWLSMQIGQKNVDLNPLLYLLKDNDAYSFMDSSNYISLKNISNVDFLERYVPVSIHDIIAVDFCSNPYINNNRINIGWLGRLDRDKIFSLINLLDNLMMLDSNRMIDLHIIGDGNSKQMIKLSNYSSKIRLIFTSYLYGEERNEYIRKNVDIMVAMGMSATDVAQLGIPTIIPIVSPKAFNDDKFIYVFDVKGFSLGWDREDIRKSGCKTYTLEDIVDDIYNNNKKELYGHKCYDFANETFSIKNSTNKLLEIIEKTNLTVNKCFSCKLIRQQMRLFSLYRLFRKNSSFARFHEFNARLRRIHQQQGIINKYKRLFLEIRSTLRRNHK